MSTISVVIATRDRSTLLKACLESIAASEIPDGWEAEVIVVDNGSTDDTEKVVGPFCLTGTTVRFGCVREPRRGKARAVNLGVEHSRGEIVAFTDDDTVADRRWLWEIIARFERDSGLSLLAGRVEMGDPSEPRVAVTWASGEVDLDHSRSLNGKILGCNLAARRKAIDRVGGLDPRLGPGTGLVCEDIDFAYRVLRAGFRGAFSPLPLVYHHHAVRDRASEYLRGWGAFYIKFVVRGDRVVARQAWWEAVRVWRSLLRGSHPAGRSPLNEAWELGAGAGIMIARMLRSALPRRSASSRSAR